jgi:dienelactone hydrolase
MGLSSKRSSRRTFLQHGVVAGLAVGGFTGSARAAGPTEGSTWMPWLSTNPTWEAFGQRALLYTGYGGADFGECHATLQAVGDAGGPDDWHREWTATAARVADAARESAERGHATSAHEAFLRASSYHRVAYFPLFGEPVDPRLKASFEHDTRCFRRAAELAPYPIEPIEIAWDGGSMPGYLARPDDSDEQRPTVVQTNGYDANVHEMFFSNAPAALRRGYNWIGFDGPGQGRNLIRDGQRLRPDWEHVVTPVIDHVLELPQVDPDRIVLVGWSMGGFLAPRAAAFEHRIAALVADPGQWDQRDAIIPALPLPDDQKARFPNIDPSALDPMEQWLRKEADPLLRWRLLQRGLWVHGCASLFEYFAAMLAYEISPVAAKIACPTVVTMADDDPIARGAPQLFDALSGKKTLIRFRTREGAGGHCQSMARSLYHQRTFDWLDDVLRCARTHTNTRRRVPRAVTHPHDQSRR